MNLVQSGGFLRQYGIAPGKEALFISEDGAPFQ